jgi:hypothetical protein
MIINVFIICAYYGAKLKFDVADNEQKMSTMTITLRQCNECLITIKNNLTLVLMSMKTNAE